MTQEEVERIKKMDVTSAEAKMALHCAALITGLKESNLLIVPNSQWDAVQGLVKDTKIDCFELFRGCQQAVLLLYRYLPLCHYLQSREVQKLLCQAGYPMLAMQGLLEWLAMRFAEYKRSHAGFPHEIGLFLGYPPEDVYGFIKNNGKNFLCTGYWKVYQDQEQKARLFQMFDRAREFLLGLLAQGIGMKDILDAA